VEQWFAIARRAAEDVSARAGLWLPGSLAWVATVGWLALLIGVGRPPSVATLTFVGAGIYTSGAWPWNAIVIVAGVVIVFGVATAFFALGEAVLTRGGGASPLDVVRTFALALMCALPALIVIAALGIAAFVVAPAEFNAPTNAGGPVVRTAMRLLPVLLALLLAIVGGTALHAAASRAAGRGRSTLAALADAPRHRGPPACRPSWSRSSFSSSGSHTSPSWRSSFAWSGRRSRRGWVRTGSTRPPSCFL
jgi:hypothetical protein